MLESSVLSENGQAAAVSSVDLWQSVTNKERSVRKTWHSCFPAFNDCRFENEPMVPVLLGPSCSREVGCLSDNIQSSSSSDGSKYDPVVLDDM